MAGLPTPKSREQILSEMLTEYVGLTGINDLNTGSVITQFFDVVARSVARTSGDIFQILRDFSVDRATGEALNNIGIEDRVYRNTAQVAGGRVKVTDTSFQKIATKIYSGASAPNVGSTVIKISDASSFPTSGRIYIGRGTPNIEGPINYSATAQVGAFWEITLDSPTKKFHNISESVILGQGGTRNIPVNTVVSSPGAGATPAVNYNVSSAAILLDGENINTNVRVTAQEPGSLANAPAGAVTEFASLPFPNAAVINETPFTTGSDDESDDDYRDRIKKARLSKGLGTALAVKNAVLGAQAPDENARVTSNEIDTTNPEETVLYIDNGEGYEEKTEGVGLEYMVDSAIGGEQNFQLQTGGRQTSIAKAFLESSISAPFNISALDKLAVLVGNTISEHTFQTGAFKANGAATAFEIVSSINDNPTLTFEATTSNSGTKVVLRAKAEDNEFIQITLPTSGNDAAPSLGFPSNEIATIFLYKNRQLLNKNGRPAFIITNNQFDWSTSIANNDTLIISVDGTNYITYTFQNQDFIEEGTYSTVSSQNSLQSWVNVLNKKVTGITAEVNGEQIKLSSNLGPNTRASLNVDSSSTLVAKGMFSSQLGLTAQGNEADFQLSRNTAQIKLNTPLVKGDSLNLGSELTRAEIKGTEILGGQVTLSDTGYLWIVVDDKAVEPVEIGVAGDTFLTVSKPSSGIVRYESTSVSAFDNVQFGDYVIIWSPQLSVFNRLEGRVNAKTSTTLDLKVTVTEYTNAVVEGPILFFEGFSVVRTAYTPQKIKVDAGVYDINDLAVIMNNQTEGLSIVVENDEFFVFRTNTESTDGSVFVVDFNDTLKVLNLTKNSKSISVNSQLAFYESEFSDKKFPAFIHGEITADVFADPITSYINSVQSSENLQNLLDPSGWFCLSQPYGSPEDIQFTECVEIEKYLGTTVNLENSPLYRRSRQNDRYHIVNPFDFGHNDSLVTILDSDPNVKTFSIPLYRTAITSVLPSVSTNNFRALDKEGGSVLFSQYFGDSFLFDNYKVLMQAKNVIDPSSAVNNDAILFKSKEWGRSGEKTGVGYFYPTAPDQGISHVISVGELVNIRVFLKSGPARATTINGTTEWNVSISPSVPGVELVTYAWSGIGNDPGLASVNSGDYVSIYSTGDFVSENQGAFRVDSATTTTFTVKRQAGEAVTQTAAATLQTSTISFFESLDTTAQEIIDYTTSNLSDYLTGTLLQDGTPTADGSGIINRSTGEDSDFAQEFVRLKDGKNYILSTDLDATAGNPHFVLKNSLELPSYSTNTANAYRFDNGEEIKLIPITSLQLSKFLNILAVTGFSTLGQIKTTNRNDLIQISTNTIGASGSVQIAGGSANTAAAGVQGSAGTIGTQDNQKMIFSVPTSSIGGFHSDQWVKLSATSTQQKNLGIGATNSIKIDQSTPIVGFSKITLTNRETNQRFFGDNRYHTRTRGRTFRLEKQGQFVCISWDENGVEPYFSKTNIEVNDTVPGTLTIYKNPTASYTEMSVDTGDMIFDEVSIGDLVQISNRTNTPNNGTFKVIGISSDYKTVRIENSNAINELIKGTFTITNNVAVVGAVFEVGGNNIEEGVDFVVGATIADTASNLSAAIANIPNITSTSVGAVVNIESQFPGVSVSISITGGGATASGALLAAPAYAASDLVFTSTIQEGDTVTINSDFNILNQGKFRLIRKFKNSFYIDNPSAIEEEVLMSDQLVSTGADGATDYTIEKIDGFNRISWGGNGAQPSFANVRPGDVLTIPVAFDASNQGDFAIVGIREISGTNYIYYKNTLGTNEANIVGSIQVHTEAMQFKEYEGVVAGDIFNISSDFLGEQNVGSYIVSDILNDSEIIVTGNMVNQALTLLDANFNKVSIDEEKVYISYKQIEFVATNPSNLQAKNVVLTTSNQFEKVNEISSVAMSAIGKFEFPIEIINGVDSYKFHTGLIGEANRIVYGDPRDNTTYPGVSAAGSEIFIKAPLVRRIEVSINVRIKTGVPFSTITEEVRNSVAALINSNPVGQPIAISNIISNVDAILGIQAVAISSPQYDPQNDVIRVNSGEKALVLDIVSDILVSKID